MSGRLQLILGFSACLLNCCLLYSEAANTVGSPLGGNITKSKDRSGEALNNGGEGGATGGLLDVSKPETDFEAYLRQLQHESLMQSSARGREDGGRGPTAVSLWTMTPQELAEFTEREMEAMSLFQVVHERMRDLVEEIVEKEQQRLESELMRLTDDQGQDGEGEQQHAGDGNIEQKIKETRDKLSGIEFIAQSLRGKIQ